MTAFSALRDPRLGPLWAALFATLVALAFLALLPSSSRGNDSADYTEYYRPVAISLLDVEGFVASRVEFIASALDAAALGGEPLRLHCLLHGQETDPARHGTRSSGVERQRCPRRCRMLAAQKNAARMMAPLPSTAARLVQSNVVGLKRTPSPSAMARDW